MYTAQVVGGSFLAVFVLLYLFNPKMVKDSGSDKVSWKKCLKWGLIAAVVVLLLVLGYVYQYPGKFKGSPFKA